VFISSPQRLNPVLLRLTLGLLALLIGATGGTLWLVHEVRREQSAIAELLRVHTSEQIDSLAPFTVELRWQLILTVALLAVLVLAFVVMTLILRGYLRSERSLRNLERQSRDILESMGQGVITGDPEGRIFMMNREAVRMLGSSFPENDATFAELDARTGLQLSGLAERALRAGQLVEDQACDFQLNGCPVYLLVDGHPLRDEGGEVHGSVLHLRDVTEAELIRRRMQRMEGYMGLGPVAAGLQHEIKNPLGALSLHVQLLNEALSGEDKPEVRESFEVLKTEVRRIGSVLEGFRDYANAEVLDVAPADLAEAVRHAVNLVAPQAREKGIAIRLDEGAPSIRLNADATRVQQVVLNLLLNAMEAMKRPGEIRVGLEDGESFVAITVADQGSGISQAALPYVFDPYFTTKESGTGMGLAVCRKIARLHGGDLQFETGPGGTEFRLTLARNTHGKF